MDLSHRRVCLSPRVIYGLFVGDVFPLATTSGINSMLGLSYSIMFILSTRDRAKAVKKFVVGVSVTALFVLYAVLAWTGLTNQSISNTGDVFGYIVVVTTLMFYLSPLAKLRRVLRTKSAASIPIAMCAMALLNNTLWLVYAILIDDRFIMVPNIVCVTFGSFQVGLYIKYRPNRDGAGKRNEGDGDEIVVVSVVRLSVDEKHSANACESPSFHAVVSPVSPVVESNSKA